MKNGEYIQYSRIFHTFAWVKTLAESPCPIMRCWPKKRVFGHKTFISDNYAEVKGGREGVWLYHGKSGGID